MNPNLPEMPKKKFPKWLLYTLIGLGAILIVFGVIFFVRKSRAANVSPSPLPTVTPTPKPTATPTIYPTPTISPTPSGSPSSTPLPSPSLTVSPILPDFPIPDGWKLQTGAFVHPLPGNKTYSVQYTFYIKNSWHCATTTLTYCMDQNNENGVQFTISETGDYDWLKNPDAQGADFTYQKIGPIITKDFNNNPLILYLVTSPTKPAILGSQDVSSQDMQMVQRSLEEKYHG